MEAKIIENKFVPTPSLNEKTPTYAFVCRGFCLTQLRDREQEDCVVSFVFSLLGQYLTLPRLVGFASAHAGRRTTARSKLKDLRPQVKYMDGGFFTLVSTFFKLFFIHVLWIRNFVVCLHHRNDAVPNKHHKIMKTIKVTYIETYIVTEERIVEVSNATFKKLQKKDSEEYQRMYEEMNGVTCAIESPTERDQTFMDIELATEKDVEEVSYTLEF